MHSLSVRSPEEHRAAVAAWAATAPANDSDVLPRKRSSESPKHAKLSDDLKILLRWKRLAVPDEPLGTNWMQAENDNYTRDPDELPCDGDAERPVRDVECEIEMRPTPDEMLRFVQQSCRKVAVIGSRGPDFKYVTAGKDVEYRTDGNVTYLRRIGGLRFAVPGDERKKGENATIGELLWWRSFKGWERPQDKLGTPHGAKESPEDVAARRDHFRQMLHCGLAEHEKTGVLPRLKPRGRIGELDTFNPRDIFVGCLVHKTGKDGTDYTAAAEDAHIKKQTAAYIRSALDPEDVKALDVGIVAENFTQVGEAFGYRDKYAERRGKAILLGAAARAQKILNAHDGA